MQVETQNVFEIGECGVGAESHVVAEKSEHQGVGERLRNDRKVHAGDARPKSKPPEHQRQQGRCERHHDQREQEMIEAVPDSISAAAMASRLPERSSTTAIVSSA